MPPAAPRRDNHHHGHSRIPARRPTARRARSSGPPAAGAPAPPRRGTTVTVVSRLTGRRPAERAVPRAPGGGAPHSAEYGHHPRALGTPPSGSRGKTCALSRRLGRGGRRTPRRQGLPHRPPGRRPGYGPEGGVRTGTVTAGGRIFRGRRGTPPAVAARQAHRRGTSRLLTGDDECCRAPRRGDIGNEGLADRYARRYGGLVTMPSVATTTSAEPPPARTNARAGRGERAAHTAADATAPGGTVPAHSPAAAERLTALSDVTASASALRRFLHGLPGVDAVGLEARAATLGTRSIKTTAKAYAIDLAISMIDLTTLEGADTAGKVRALCAKGVRPDPTDRSTPQVAAICVYSGHGGHGQGGAGAAAGVHVASVATAFPSGRAALRREARRHRGRGRRGRRRDRHGDRPRRVPVRPVHGRVRGDPRGQGGVCPPGRRAASPT